MSVVPHAEDPQPLTVVPPTEALLRARPLPTDEEMAIDGLTEEEWTAFENALAERWLQPSTSAVVVDTMVVSSIVNAVHDPALAESYRSLIAGRPILISFATVTEMRYGALKANWGEFRRRGLDRDLAQLTIVQPDDDLMRE